jgi:hypothetical protein
VLGWYNVNVLELSAGHPRVLTRFLEVMHLTRSPFALFSPVVLVPVLRRALGLVPRASRGSADSVKDVA